MLHNDLAGTFVYIHLHTLQPSLEIFDVALYLALRSELIAGEVRVVRTIAVVVVEGMLQ